MAVFVGVGVVAVDVDGADVVVGSDCVVELRKATIKKMRMVNKQTVKLANHLYVDVVLAAEVLFFLHWYILIRKF